MYTALPLVKPFRADPSALAEVRAFIRASAVDAWLSEEAAEDLALATTEACRDLLAHERSSFMFVSWWAHAGRVEIRVRDEGVLGEAPTVQGPGGADAGLRFPYILAFVDEVDLRPGTRERPGTSIRLVKEIKALAS
jgi:anti-sigma regulatory factor (Ser/Thr protein kinase)